MNLKLHKLLNKFDNIKLYKFISYKDCFINEILNFRHMDYKEINREIKDIQYFFNKQTYKNIFKCIEMYLNICYNIFVGK